MPSVGKLGIPIGFLEKIQEHFWPICFGSYEGKKYEHRSKVNPCKCMNCYIQFLTQSGGLHFSFWRSELDWNIVSSVQYSNCRYRRNYSCSLNKTDSMYNASPNAISDYAFAELKYRLKVVHCSTHRGLRS